MTLLGKCKQATLDNQLGYEDDNQLGHEDEENNVYVTILSSRLDARGVG